jgi:hypothetical protein
MPSTYTTNLGIEKIATGEQSGTWGSTTNTNLDLLDQAVNGVEQVTLAAAGSSGSPNDLPITDGTASDGRNKFIEFIDGGDLGGTAYVQLTPNDAEKIVFLRNSLSASRSVIVFQGTYNASNDFEIPNGKDVVLKFDGAGASATVTQMFVDLKIDALDATTVASTNVNATTVDSTNVEVTNIKAKDGTASATIADSTGVMTIASAVLTTADINGGTADNVTIGGGTAAAGTFTTATATTGNITTVNATTVDTTNIEVTNVKAKDGTASATIADSTGVMTIASSVLTTTDINGGTIDGVTIGGASAGAITGTTITGTSFVSSGDMTFGDNDKAIFGAGSDLQIYHDGSHSIIADAGTGHLKLLAADLRINNAADTETFIAAYENSKVDIYYDNSVKLATTATGIDVTGAVTADGLTVDGNSRINGDFTIDTAPRGYVFASTLEIGSGGTLAVSGNANTILVSNVYFASDATYKVINTGLSAAAHQLYSGSHVFTTASAAGTAGSSIDLFTRMNIARTGDISFYEDTGTTPKFFWDASEESLGIRSTTPGSNANFEVIGDTSVGTGGATIRVGQDGTTDGSADTGSAMLFAGHDGSVQRDFARIAGLKENGTSGNYASYLTLSTRANGGSITERLRITSAGQVGIGTSSPEETLSVMGDFQVALNTSVTGRGLKVSTSNGAITDDTVAINAQAVTGVLAFQTNSSERMRLDTTGRLLVGTSSARSNFFNTASSAPQQLQVEGINGNACSLSSICSVADTSGGRLLLAHQRSGAVGGNTILNSGDQAGYITFQGNDGGQFVECASIEAVIDGTPGADDMPGRLVFSTTADGAATPTERMRIDSSGRVGLGVTPSVWYTLGGYKVMQIGPGMSFDSGNDFRARVASNAFVNSSGTFKYLNTGFASNYNQASGQHQWFTAPSGTSGNTATFTQAMTLSAAGGLSVGTTTDAGAGSLLVTGGVRSTSLTTNFSGTDNAAANYFGNNSGGGYLHVFGSTHANANRVDLYGNTIQLSGNSGASVHAIIDASGNLLVGPASGSNHVIQKSAASTIALNINNSSATAPSGVSFTFSAATPNDGTSTFFTTGDSTAYRGGWLSNGGVQNYQANDSNLSDRREKTNFSPAKSYLETICAIPVQTFNYIDQNMEKDPGLTLGVVAQDVQEVAPELIMESNWGTEENPKMRLSIYQTDLQYALMKALQELKAENDALKSRLDAAGL